MDMSRYGIYFILWTLKNLAKFSFGMLSVHIYFRLMKLTLPKSINRASVLNQFVVSTFVIYYAITWKSICQIPWPLPYPNLFLFPASAVTRPTMRTAGRLLFGCENVLVN
jgi:hypothetical protein